MFYQALKTALAGKTCNPEGTACPVIASQELRRLACGGDWVASSAEGAWTDFLAALDNGRTRPGETRVQPDVREWRTDGSELSETCDRSAFMPPRTVFADRARIRGAIVSDLAPWEERHVSVPVRSEDLPWKNYAPGIYRFFAVRVCPTVRPVPRGTQGFFVQILPVESSTARSTCPG